MIARRVRMGMADPQLDEVVTHTSARHAPSLRTSRSTQRSSPPLRSGCSTGSRPDADRSGETCGPGRCSPRSRSPSLHGVAGSTSLRSEAPAPPVRPAQSSSASPSSTARPKRFSSVPKSSTPAPNVEAAHQLASRRFPGRRQHQYLTTRDAEPLRPAAVGHKPSHRSRPRAQKR